MKRRKIWSLKKSLMVSFVIHLGTAGMIFACSQPQITMSESQSSMGVELVSAQLLDTGGMELDTAQDAGNQQRIEIPTTTPAMTAPKSADTAYMPASSMPEKTASEEQKKPAASGQAAVMAAAAGGSASDVYTQGGGGAVGSQPGSAGGSGSDGPAGGSGAEEASEASCLYAPRPAYPASARESGWEGSVVIRLSISADGTVDGAQIREASQYPVFDEAALAAVRRWRFSPAQQGGHPVSSLHDVRVYFHLDDD